MKRIRYVSRFASPMSREEVDEIAQSAAERNAREGITGVLIASGNLFFQLIEGPDNAIDECFARILKDPRHVDIQSLGIVQGELPRLCPDWAMKKVDLTHETAIELEPLRALVQILATQRQLVEELTDVLQRVMWRELIYAESSTLSE